MAAPRAGCDSIRGRPIEILIREDVHYTSGRSSVEIFDRLGMVSRLVTESEIDVSPDRILFVSGNTRSYRRTLQGVGAMPRDERPGVILWHTEPLPMPRSAGLRAEPLTLRELAKIALRDRRINDHHSHARHLKKVAGQGVVDVFAVTTKSYQAYLAEHGVAVEQVPFGHHPSQGHLLDLERDIDVLFLGDHRLRRRRRVLRSLRREGLDVLVLGDYSNPDLWGEPRNELMNRTKIMLHIPRLEGHCSDIRMNMAMSTGALLVSEPLCLPYPYKPGEHYVESPLDELADTVRRYLADDEERRRIRASAHAFMSELTLERSFARLLTLAAERLPA